MSSSSVTPKPFLHVPGLLRRCAWYMPLYSRESSLIVEVAQATFKKIKGSGAEESVYAKLYEGWKKSNYSSEKTDIQDFGKKAFKDINFPLQLKIEALYECAREIELTLTKLHVWDVHFSTQKFNVTLYRNQNKLEYLVKRYYDSESPGLPLPEHPNSLYYNGVYPSDEYSGSINLGGENIDEVISELKNCIILPTEKQKTRINLKGTMHFVPTENNFDKQEVDSETIRLATEIASGKELHVRDVYNLEDRYQITFYQNQNGLGYIAHRATDSDHKYDVAEYIPISSDKTIEQRIEYLRECEIQFPRQFSRKYNEEYRRVFMYKSPNLIGPVSFLPKVSSESKFDPELSIDCSNWAITLVDSASSGVDPLSWGGHARIVIEGVAEGRYFQHLADLVYHEKTRIRYFDSKNYKVSFADGYLIDNPIVGYSSTFIRPVESIQKLLNSIGVDREYATHNIGYNLAGDSQTLGSSIVDSIASISDSVENIWQFKLEKMPNWRKHNCLTWALEKLALVDIHFSDTPTSIFIKTPKQYTNTKP